MPNLKDLIDFGLITHVVVGDSKPKQDGDIYYTVVIPYQEHNATEWHPTDKEGSFSMLTRGRFKTAGEASYWAKQNLGVGAWYVKAVG